FIICSLFLLLAQYSVADASELISTDNGFLYDAPPRTSVLPLAPLDMANDLKTQTALAALTPQQPILAPTEPKTSSRVIVEVIPSLSTSYTLDVKAPIVPSAVSSLGSKPLNVMPTTTPLFKAPIIKPFSFRPRRPGYDYAKIFVLLLACAAFVRADVSHLFGHNHEHHHDHHEHHYHHQHGYEYSHQEIENHPGYDYPKPKVPFELPKTTLPPPPKPTYLPPEPPKPTYLPPQPPKPTYLPPKPVPTYLPPPTTTNLPPTPPKPTYLPPTPPKPTYLPPTPPKPTYLPPTPPKPTYLPPKPVPTYLPPKPTYLPPLPPKPTYLPPTPPKPTYLPPTPPKPTYLPPTTPVAQYLPPQPIKSEYLPPKPNKSEYLAPAPTPTFKIPIPSYAAPLEEVFGNELQEDGYHYNIPAKRFFF
ncbi:uncharacterized protein LOC133328622, partial [Musca vetustissima]|uniref:uncharacterized protein LOC133328622 n=1 Tax=Musca vetustissima TaxID=27455 RepID=UPI002AB7E928